MIRQCLVALLVLACARPVVAAVPVASARLEGDEDRAAMVVAFAGDPTVALRSNPASRWVILEFDGATFGEATRVLTSPSKLVEAASLEQIGAAKMRAAVRVAAGTHVGVYRRPGGAQGSSFTVLVQPDGPDGRLPVKGRLSSRYGWRMHPILHEARMHEGIDIAVPEGTPIRSVDDGEVTWAGWKGAAGQCVIVRHAGDVESKYMHCSRIHVRVGQRVKRRQVLAAAGETGMATGPHVHFAVTRNGRVIDPMRYLKTR